MDAGLVVGLSLGLAVLVLIILVFGCKFARRNTKKLNDLSKDKLLGNGVYRRKTSRTSRQEMVPKRENGHKKTKNGHRQKTGRKKSVTFNEKDKAGGIDEEDRKETNYSDFEPRQRLFREYTGSDDNAGIPHVDKWSRDYKMDCKRNYDSRGCKRKNLDTFSERPNNRDELTSNKRNEKSEHYLETERLNFKRPKVHKCKFQGDLEEHTSVPRKVTVKQIVEEVKRNSAHNFQEGTRIKVDYDTFRAENDSLVKHECKKTENKNTSSGKKHDPQHQGINNFPNKTSDRLLSRPQEGREPSSSQEQRETLADRRVHKIEESEKREQKLDRSRQGEETYVYLSTNNKHTHHLQMKPDEYHKPQAITENPNFCGPKMTINNTQNTGTLNCVEKSDKRSDTWSETVPSVLPQSGMMTSNKPVQYSEDRISAKVPTEYICYSEALETLIHNRKIDEKTPRPSTAVSCAVNSHRPTTSMNANRTFAAPYKEPDFRNSHLISATVEHTPQVSGLADSRLNYPVPPLNPQPPRASAFPSSEISTVPQSQVSTKPSLRQKSPQSKRSSPTDTPTQIGSQPPYSSQTSPARTLLSAVPNIRSDKQLSPTIDTLPQLVPTNTLPSVSPKLLPNLEQSIAQQRESEMSPDKDIPMGNSLQSQTPKPPTLRPPVPPRPYKPSMQHPSPRQLVPTQASSPRLQASEIIPPLSTPDPPKTAPNENDQTEEFTDQMHAEVQLPEDFPNGYAIANTVNKRTEKEQITVGTLTDDKRAEPHIEEKIDLKCKDSVDSLTHESKFNPGQTSTPQQSTTEIHEEKNCRSNRSVLRSVLLRRRERITSSSQNISNFCDEEPDSFWNESISPIRKSSVVDGRSVKLQQDESTDTNSTNKPMSRVSSDLTEKIATVRDLRKDPDVNALLSDIRARRKSSSSFN